MKVTKLLFTILTLLMLILPFRVYAQPADPQPFEPLPGLDYKDFGGFDELLASIRGLLVPLGFVLALILIVKCGYQFITSQGDPYKLKDAQECLTSAIIGLVVVLLSVSILSTLINSTITNL